MLFKTLTFPQNLSCLKKGKSLNNTNSHRKNNVKCWIQKEPQDQSALQLHHADVYTETKTC